ncbi:glycosyltransferase [Erysipelothrix rhusiopathiae]|uniref:Glycosyl transferase, group 1 n=1 Tax=Erysipelothrix rhusiopathiae TaxID=1648 RepID=A0A2Z6FZ58_ERYRH|nr:glycosyltransferase [Erysipelothrix rhusiopathiae]MDE8042984.1 glycosyltransferase [Erysipelothrix rhusiopathiae]MDE8054142.1 glycosyltransferase [Erysipelothrix rhusiopathiae]MDE8055983.1 glycosyltransferase [Erysipelothrix rhusiopathiae]MDE8059154.1 glycosyltransferase [Erysipelothrix rhusiopathiae]
MNKCLIVTTVGVTIKAFLLPHIEYLKKQGYSVEVASNFDDIRDEAYKLIEGTNVVMHQIDFTRSPKSIPSHFKSYKQIASLINSEKYNKIFVHTPIAAFLTRKAAYRSGAEVTYFAHGLHFYNGAPMHNWLIFETIEKVALKWTDNVVTINQEDYDYFMRVKPDRVNLCKIPGIGLSKSFMIKLEQNQDSLDESFGIHADDLLVLSIGELNENKNHILAIKAMKNLIEKNKKVKYIILGTGDRLNEYQEYIAENNLENNIFFGGYQSNVVPFLERTDLFLSCSYREGLPVSVLEAMATKKPVLLSNIRGHVDLIKNDKFIYDIKSISPEGLANHIENLISDKHELEEEGIRNYNMSSKYQLDNVFIALNDVYCQNED